MRGAETAWSVQCLGRGLDCRRVVRLPAVSRYAGCIKMIGAVWKLIMFTSMVNRIINTSRNERVTLQVYDTCLHGAHRGDSPVPAIL